MAKSHGVTDAQLASIAGSGEQGRVTKKDLEAFLGGAKPAGKAAAPPEAGSNPPGAAEPLSPKDKTDKAGKARHKKKTRMAKAAQ